jgi:hypothetical protein
MITTLRVFFLGRVLREKLLLVAFIAIAAVIWISSFSSRTGAFLRAMNSTSDQLKVQQKWWDDREKIDADAKKAAGDLDAARALDATRLITTVRNLALEAGLTNSSFDTTQQRTATGSTLGVTIPMLEKNALKNWEAVKKFYLSLQRHHPYIVVEQMALQTQARNEGPLTLFIKVSALQIH